MKLTFNGTRSPLGNRLTRDLVEKIL